MPERRFQFAAVAATLLFCSAAPCDSPSGPGLVEMLPADTIAIARVRIGELRASSIYRNFEERLAFGHSLGLEQFVELTGVDPVNDVDEVVIALLPAGPGRAGRHAVGIARGRFDERQTVESLLKADAKLTSENSSAVALYSLSGSTDRVLTIASPELIVFGNRHSVEYLLDSQARPHGALAADSRLRDVFDDHPGSAQLWGSVALDRLLQLDGGEQKLPPALVAIRALPFASFELEFGQDLQLKLTGFAASADDALLVHQALNGALAMSKLSAKENDALLAILEKAVLTQSLDHVTLELALFGDRILGD